MYLTPDGSRRNLYSELHPGHPSPAQADTWFTRDGTYLRMKRFATNSADCTLSTPAGATVGCHLIEFPSAEIHEFRNFGTTDADWRVVRMRDRFGNAVDATKIIGRRVCRQAKEKPAKTRGSSRAFESGPPLASVGASDEPSWGYGVQAVTVTSSRNQPSRVAEQSVTVVKAM